MQGIAALRVKAGLVLPLSSRDYVFCAFGPDVCPIPKLILAASAQFRDEVPWRIFKEALRRFARRTCQGASCPLTRGKYFTGVRDSHRHKPGQQTDRLALAGIARSN